MKTLRLREMKSDACDGPSVVSTARFQPSCSEAEPQSPTVGVSVPSIGCLYFLG